MTTIKKSSRTSRKSASSRVNSASVNLASVEISAPAGASIGSASGSAAPIGAPSLAAVGSGLPAAAEHVANVTPIKYNKVRQTAGSQINNVAIMESESELKINAFRSKVAQNWAAPEWSGAAALRATLSGLGLDSSAVEAAIRKQAISEGFSFDAVCPSVADVCAYIGNDATLAKEFKTLCGCAVPAADNVRIYSPTNLSVSTITANSVVSDYLHTSSVPAGLSASGVVGALLSVRFLVDIRRRLAAARAAARNDLKNNAANLVRCASRLGVSAAVLSRYLRLLGAAVPAADEKEKKRLTANLSRCWASLRTIENRIVLAAPAGSYGAIEDNDGGWCFPASLPASAPAKVRKLWASRVRVLSSIATLENMLKMSA